MHNRKRGLVIFLLVITLALTGVITVFAWQGKVAHAMMGMVWGVIVFWIFLCGGLMYWFRDRIRSFVLRLPIQWQIKFFFFITFLALVEEAVTTTMTNLAPFFGVAIGEAYITASTNFLDVVLFHSVIGFMGAFLFWALAFKRYDFSPFAAFLTFGVSGVFAEVGFGGPQHFAAFAFWIFVYGLMMYLPAYCLPAAEERGVLRKPRFYIYPIMVFLPAVFTPLFFWIPKVIDPAHPQPTHFQPINS